MDVIDRIRGEINAVGIAAVEEFARQDNELLDRKALLGQAHERALEMNREFDEVRAAQAEFDRQIESGELTPEICGNDECGYTYQGYCLDAAGQPHKRPQLPWRFELYPRLTPRSGAL